MGIAIPAIYGGIPHPDEGSGGISTGGKQGIIGNNWGRLLIYIIVSFSF
jgi:hypothetical protein